MPYPGSSGIHMDTLSFKIGTKWRHLCTMSLDVLHNGNERIYIYAVSGKPCTITNIGPEPVS